MRTQILGSGFVTGQNLVTNDQLARMMDTSDGWIRERSGVETRYYVEQGTTTSDLDAGVAKEEIDYIVFATMTPDHYFPGCGGEVVVGGHRGEHDVIDLLLGHDD